MYGNIPIPFKVTQDCEMDILQAYYYRRLFQMTLSVFEWSGDLIDNKEIDPNYLEIKLITLGNAGLTDIEGTKRATECSKIGYDWYGLPTYTEIVNPTLSYSPKKYFGKDIVLVKNNKLLLPTTELIKHYSKILAQSELSFRINLQNSQDQNLYVVEDEAQAQQVRAFVDIKNSGKPNLLIKNNLMAQITKTTSNGTIPVVNTPSNFIGDKLVQIQTKIYDEYFYNLGIDSNGGNQLKSQYNNLSETNSNNQQILVNRAYWLEEREKACEEFNKMFNSNLSVKMREGAINYGISDKTESFKGQDGMSLES